MLKTVSGGAIRRCEHKPDIVTNENSTAECSNPGQQTDESGHCSGKKCYSKPVVVCCGKLIKVNKPLTF